MQRPVAALLHFTRRGEILTTSSESPRLTRSVWDSPNLWCRSSLSKADHSRSANRITGWGRVHQNTSASAVEQQPQVKKHDMEESSESLHSSWRACLGFYFSTINSFPQNLHPCCHSYWSTDIESSEFSLTSTHYFRKALKKTTLWNWCWHINHNVAFAPFDTNSAKLFTVIMLGSVTSDVQFLVNSMIMKGTTKQSQSPANITAVYCSAHL